MLLVPPRGENFQPCPLKQNLSTSYFEYGWYTWNWFDQAGSSRCEKLLCPAVKCMLARKTLEEGSFSHWIRHLIFTKRIFNKKKNISFWKKWKKVFFQAFALHVSFLPKYAVSLQNLGLSIWRGQSKRAKQLKYCLYFLLAAKRKPIIM